MAFLYLLTRLVYAITDVGKTTFEASLYTLVVSCKSLAMVGTSLDPAVHILFMRDIIRAFNRKKHL